MQNEYYLQIKFTYHRKLRQAVIYGNPYRIKDIITAHGGKFLSFSFI